MTIGAIETRYAGHVFRSRLEARWAVFFDELKIEWQYELQGFVVDGSRYLPDFYLPRQNTWCEVKGDPNGIRSDFDRMVKILSEDSPLPGFASGESELVILGDIPRNTDGFVLHPTLKRRAPQDGLLREWWCVIPLKSVDEGVHGWCPILADDGSCLLASLLDIRTARNIELDGDGPGWSTDTKTILRSGFYAVTGAYDAARSARFEHGQYGAIARSAR